MATKQRLSYSGTNHDFSPGPGYIWPDIPERVTPRSLDGDDYFFEFHHKKRWEVPIVDVTKTIGDSINTWWEEGYECIFYPDYVGAPATSYTVRIKNSEKPLFHKYRAHWDAHFSGILILEET